MTRDMPSVRYVMQDTRDLYHIASERSELVSHGNKVSIYRVLQSKTYRKRRELMKKFNAEINSVRDEVRETFRGVDIGTELSTQEIKRMVYMKYGRNKGSVIPSDYCYNRCNNGINYEKSLHIFEYLEDNRYKYLGENYPYTGFIYRKPKDSDVEIIVGKMVDGNLVSPINIKLEITKETSK